MKLIITLLMAFIITALAVPVISESITLTGPKNAELAEGKSYHITWNSEGLESVSVVAFGTLTKIPGHDRGDFSIVIAEAAPASRGSVNWTVPFLDTDKFRIKVKGYNGNGQAVDSSDRLYSFRPAVLRTRSADGIYIDVRREDRQRLYVIRDNKVIRAYLTSGAYQGEFYPRNVHPKKPHDHPGVFRVTAKYPNWYSRMFQVDMPWAMRYHGGHFIHATSPPFYNLLGTAASNGCNRLELSQAKELYDMTPVGTRVEIIAG